MTLHFDAFDIQPFTFWFLTNRPISDPSTMPFHMRVAGSYEIYGASLEVSHRELTQVYTTSVYNAANGGSWVPTAAFSPDYDYTWWDPYWRFDAMDIPGLSSALTDHYGAHILFDKQLF
jgi:hypothetical protein